MSQCSLLPCDVIITSQVLSESGLFEAVYIVNILTTDTHCTFMLGYLSFWPICTLVSPDVSLYHFGYLCVPFCTLRVPR